MQRHCCILCMREISQVSLSLISMLCKVHSVFACLTGCYDNMSTAIYDSPCCCVLVSCLLAVCEAFRPRSGPANDIKKMGSETPAEGASATWCKLLLASRASIWAARAQAFLRCLCHTTARPLFDDACMAAVPHDDLPYLMPATSLFFGSLVCVMQSACAMPCMTLLRLRYRWNSNYKKQ